MDREINILSITGGGMRGLVTLYEMKALEDKLDRPLSEYFDYIGGTSTGGIIASMLAFGFDIQQTINFYEKHGPKIFEKKFFRWGLLRPKYDDRYFNKITRQTFKGLKISDSSVNLVVPAYDIDNFTKRIFKSYDTREEVDMFDVIRSTASAQTYFKVHSFDGANFIDGGMVINNPSQLLFIEALYKIRNGEAKGINIVSFGTGRKDTDIKVSKRGKGKLFWAKPTIDILLNEQARTTDYYLNRIVGTLGSGSYFNIEPILNRSSKDIDDASKSNLAAMRLDGIESAEKHIKIINKVAEKLESTCRQKQV